MGVVLLSWQRIQRPMDPAQATAVTAAKTALPLSHVRVHITGEG